MGIRMMKTVAIALLAALAFAEPEAKAKADADPYLLYGGYYGHALGYLVTTILPMDIITMESVRPRLNQKLMLTPTCFMVDTMDLAIMDLDMDTTDILMLTMERGQLMLNQRLMPI